MDQGTGGYQMTTLIEHLRYMASDSMGMEAGDRQILAEAADLLDEIEALAVEIDKANKRQETDRDYAMAEVTDRIRAIIKRQSE